MMFVVERRMPNVSTADLVMLQEALRVAGMVAPRSKALSNPASPSRTRKARWQAWWRLS
jgi:hypothetical protein